MSPPPRKPLGSNDSFPPLTDDQVEKILGELAGVEGRLLGHMGTQNQRLDKHEQELQSIREGALANAELRTEVRDLNTSVRALLERDVNHEGRLGRLEAVAQLAGSEAGKDSGKAAGAGAGRGWGAAAGFVAAVIIALVQQCSHHVPQ